MSDEILEEEKNIYDAELEKDSQAFEAYLNHVYIKNVPRPKPPTKEELGFWKIAGLESSLFVLSAVGAAVLSSVRTGGVFWLLESLLFDKFGLDQKYSSFGNVFGLVAMVSSLLAFEGFLLAFGLSKGRESGKIEVSRIGLVISLLTVIVAGVFSSFSIVDVGNTAQMWMNIILAIITGASSALVAFYSSENFGFILNNVKKKKNDLISDHQDEDSKWRKKAREEYNKSSYNIRKKSSEKVYSNPSGNVANQPVSQIQQPDIAVQNKKLSKSERAYAFVRGYYETNGMIPTNQLIVDNAEVSLGTAHSSIKTFKLDYAEELLAKGLVTQEELEKLSGSEIHSNVQNPIDEFISRNGRFPNTDELTSMGVSIQDAAKYVQQNETALIDNGILDSETVEKAKNYQA